MEAKRRIGRAFYWIDTKLAWLLHFPKPVDWEEFGRKLKEATEEDKRRTIAMIEAAKQAGRKEVVEWVEEYGCFEECDPDTQAYFTPYRWTDEGDWQDYLKKLGIDRSKHPYNNPNPC